MVEQQSRTYTEWNNILASRFFHPGMDGQPIHISVTAQLIKELGAESIEQFVHVVKRGPADLVKHDLSLCLKAYHVYEYWLKHRKLYKYPPYFAFLCLFVLAAGIDGDYAAQAYYPRLRALLGEPPTSGTYPSFNLMADLWNDLETWSIKDQRGKLGIFEVRLAGSWVHVGLPIAQVILTEAERKCLSAIFDSAGLDPTSNPSDIQLAWLVRHSDPARCLRNWTKQLLAPTNLQDDAYQVLIGIMRDELAAWDGTVETGAVQDTYRKKTLGSLKVCLYLDKVVLQVRAVFRCNLRNAFPENGIVLRPSQMPQGIVISEEIPGWSQPLRDAEENTVINASDYDWSNVFEIEDSYLGWRLRLPGNSVRVFFTGSSEGLPGLVESQQLPRKKQVYIAIHDSATPALEKWGASGCRGFRDLKIKSGLPPNWRLYTAEEVLSDELIRNEYHNLSFTNLVRFTYAGGVRAPYGNTYLSICPPRIKVEGMTGDEQVYCDDILLNPYGDSNLYDLPPDLPLDTRILLSVKRGNSEVAQRSLYITDDFETPHPNSRVLFDRFDDLLLSPSGDLSGVNGAYSKGIDVPKYHFLSNPQAFMSNEVIFIGAQKGQIIDWPREALDDDWLPVWAIPVNRANGKAVFCGRGMIDPNLSESLNVRPKDVKYWAEVLWHWRKRITPPRDTELFRLWTRYQKAARDV